MNILNHIIGLFRRNKPKPDPRYPNAYEPGKGGALYSSLAEFLPGDSSGIELIYKMPPPARIKQEKFSFTVELPCKHPKAKYKSRLYKYCPDCKRTYISH